VRATCLERHEALHHHVAHRLGGVLSLAPARAGTHVLGSLADAAVGNAAGSAVGDDPARAVGGVAPSPAVRVAGAAAAAGLVVFPLSRYCLRPPSEDALVLGYGGLTPARVARGVEQLARAIDSLGGARGRR
jgi:DNA-binding transcriptional MocR family regulator